MTKFALACLLTFTTALAACSGTPPPERQTELQKALQAEENYQERVARGEGEEDPDDEVICEPYKVTGSNIYKVACDTRRDRRAQSEANRRAAREQLAAPGGKSCTGLQC